MGHYEALKRRVDRASRGRPNLSFVRAVLRAISDACQKSEKGELVTINLKEVLHDEECKHYSQ